MSGLAPLEGARSFGDYEIIEELGRGGMGVVYRARQRSLGRIVALKVMLGGTLASANELRRFRLEAAATARLDHPNIVAVHEVGEQDGLRYFTMQLVEGRSLLDCGDRYAGDPRGAAALIEKAARAIQFAHEHGILHRDVKPANILVDARGEPHLVDFGLARVLDAEEDLTKTGDIVGTLVYLAPEILRRGKYPSTAACDVYSLGAVLYELITGVKPFSTTTPYQTIAEVLSREPDSPRLLNNRVNRDLETICLRAIEKDPGRRYSSAAALADDLRSYLEGRPIAARAITSRERVWKWVRRRPAVSALLAVCALGLVAAAAGAAWHAERLGLSVLESRRHLYLAEMSVAQQAWKDGQIERVRSILSRHIPAPGEEDLRGFEWYHLLWRANSLLCEAPMVNDGHPVLALSPAGDLLATGGSKGLIGLRDPRDLRLLRVLEAEQQILALAFSPDGKLLASSSGEASTPEDGGLVVIWDVASGAATRSLESSTHHVLALAFASEEVLALGEPGGLIRLVSVETGEEVAQATSGEGLRGLWLTRYGQTLLAVHRQGVSAYDAVSGDPLGLLATTGGAVWCVARSPDLESIAVGRENGLLSLLTPPARAAGALEGFAECRSTGHQGNLSTLGYSPDSRILACGHLADVGASDAGELVLRDPASLLPLGGVKRPQGVRQLLFTPDGSRIVTSERDAVRVWDVSRLLEPSTIRLHQETSLGRLSPDGRTFACGNEHGCLRILDVASGSELSAADTDVGPCRCIAYNADGSIIAIAGGSRSVQLWDAARKQKPPLATLATHVDRIRCMAFDPESRWLAVGTQRIVRIWELKSRTSLDLKAHAGKVDDVAFTPDGTTLITRERDGNLKLWNVPAWSLQGTIDVGRRGSSTFALARDGKLLAVGYRDGGIEAFDVRTLRSVCLLQGDGAGVTALAFAPDGTSIASSSASRLIKLWDLKSGRERMVLDLAQSNVSHVAFSGDGRTLVAGEWPVDLRIWRTAPEAEVASLREPKSAPTAPTAPTVPLAPTGERLPATPGAWTSVQWPGLDIAGDCQQGVWGDYDADGDLDLFLAMNGPDRLFENRQGELKEATPPALADEFDTRGAAWGDFDQDGDLDLLLANGNGDGDGNGKSRLFLHAPGTGFSEAGGWAGGEPMPLEDVAPADFDLDGDLDLYANAAAGPDAIDAILANDGAARFTRVLEEAMAPLGPLGSGAWGDYDADGFPDLFTGVPEGRCFLLRNERGRSLANATTLIASRGALRKRAYSGAWGDYDADGNLDLFLSRRNYPNRLLRQENGSFRDMNMPSVTQRSLSRGALWGDFDLDGDLDLFVSDEKQLSRLALNEPRGSEPPQLVDATRGPLRELGKAYAASAADFDGDGDLDLLVSDIEGPVRLLRNDLTAARHWLQVRLEGTSSNRWGLGSRVRVVAGGRSQVRELAASGASAAQPLIAHFGLGEAQEVELLEIRWPSGELQEVRGVPVDQVVTVRELPR